MTNPLLRVFHRSSLQVSHLIPNFATLQRSIQDYLFSQMPPVLVVNIHSRPICATPVLTRDIFYKTKVKWLINHVKLFSGVIYGYLKT
jgi:hypothetical protein